MRSTRLALLTIFALPFPVIAALVSIHCQGAALTSSFTNEPIAETVLDPATAGGQSITSVILSPAAMTGGEPAAGTVYLRYPAPSGGLTVTLRANGATLPDRIVIPQGKSSVSFAITTKPVNSAATVNVSATCQNATVTTAMMVLPAAKRVWYVSPKGNPMAAGTASSPWDLATALSHGPGGNLVRPGDRIWLRGGRYTGTFVSALKGTAQAPIIVRAFPGERVIIDKAAANVLKQPALKVKGPWVWFWGIEVMNSNTDRRRNSPYSDKDEPWRGSGVDVYAANVKLINMIFHDNGHGVWDKQDMTEVHGSLFFYNGNNKREHALYVGNAAGTKYITDNIVFAQGGYGILGHSDSNSSSQKGLHLEGNITFNNGILTADDQRTGNLQVGGVKGVSAERVVISNNYVYNAPTNAENKNNGIRVGYEDMLNRDVKLLDNYVVSKIPVRLWWWEQVDFVGNTIYSSDEALELKMPRGINSRGYRWDFNTYLSDSNVRLKFASDSGVLGFSQWRQETGFDAHSQFRTGQPSGVQVFVRPNRYEPGRGNIVVYNWDLRDSVGVDVSAVLTPGTQFEIRDAQNYFGEPVLRGVYKGGTLQLPTRLSRVAAPVGNVERLPVHTAPQFLVFVIQPVGCPTCFSSSVLHNGSTPSPNPTS
ncbi:MAG TPA: hypothetical protein VJV03_11205 [Pyrinomonadaceae bacterium]|nr:hypothetical protein [Pyrinomonadaceae bacterium]